MCCHDITKVRLLAIIFNVASPQCSWCATQISRCRRSSKLVFRFMDIVTIMDSVRVWFGGPSVFFCLEKLKCLKVKIDFNLYKNVLYIPGVVKHLQLFLLQIWIFPSIEIDWNLSARKLDKAPQAFHPSSISLNWETFLMPHYQKQRRSQTFNFSFSLGFGFDQLEAWTDNLIGFLFLDLLPLSKFTIKSNTKLKIKKPV